MYLGANEIVRAIFEYLNSIYILTLAVKSMYMYMSPDSNYAKAFIKLPLDEADEGSM